ncbi:ABC transporter substrate-binding protein [Pseudomonas fragariae (ex Marin et al. 2024)]|uniref:Transporter substrate-binding domain-containing protein n=1 Tax=Pseudomonas syringae UB303 TaxID=1357287 RepID=A0AAJ4AZ13_PSESX|nr:MULTISPECIES: ABC transporter substrate-binding protein [Pseudomonas]AKF46209.1 amino acid ABC transporter substrate-binding protein, PAAT family [Pseudomonas syringae pv. syringae B301D]EXL31276.1 glutamine ABC transporter substrate-binding protein [Pseudomonas syringae pv. syringae str. B301D-R]KWS25851.1 ABC transporter [Pseudomonas syringae pv. syringae]MCA5973811.1 ABC transporter substrate-binding protein [Pseudomonas sp. P135]MCH5535872.1 ABC transporter substrate-binding protein [Ps
MRIKSVLAALALSPLAVSVVHADQLSDVMSKKSLSCGVYADVPPFSAPDPETRELVGMDVDLCKALAKHMGVELELKPLSVEARIPEVKMGRVDVIFANLAYTKSRAEQIQFSDPYYIAKETLVVRAANADQPKSFFKGKRISSTKGSTSEQSIRLADATPVTFQDTGSAYMALQQNKVVGLVTNTMTAIKLVGQAKAGGVELAIAKEPMALEPIGAGMRQGEPAFLAKVNESLRAMEAAGEIDAIWARWIGPNTEYKMVREDKVQSLSELKFDPLP